MDKKVYVTLENGKVFEGYSFGAEREVVGELVFTTGMTGYIETLTDPSYFGQIVTQTFPLIGNYGMIPEDCESGKCWVSGYIVREKCDAPSNFRCEKTVCALLEEPESTTIGICVVSSVLSPVHFTAAKLPVENAEARRSELGSLWWPSVGDPAEEAARADAPDWLLRAARCSACGCFHSACPDLPVG